MPARKRQLLIVDPDATFAGIYARRFEAARWVARLAPDAKEARKLVAKKAPDAMLLDADTVPEAFALVRALKEDPTSSGIVVVALTARGDREHVRETLACGTDGYLLKGHVTPTETRAHVERLVKERVRM